MLGKVIIFSAPSGAGKSTVVNHLLGLYPQFEFSISATSRSPRGQEQDGVEYYFIDAERFRELIAQDAFVEYEEVYHDRFYGTLKSEVERIWQKGHVIVFDVDVKGGVNLKNLRDYLSCDKIAACGGTWMVKGDMIKAGEFDKIKKLVAEAAAIVKEVRG